MFVNHDVTIVPILDLQQVADKRVGSHTPDEVAASLRKESVWYACKSHNSDNMWEKIVGRPKLNHTCCQLSFTMGNKEHNCRGRV